MNKSLISSIAAATLVGSIGLVYAQSQGTDTSAQPGVTQADQSTQAATTDSSTPSSSMTSSPDASTSTNSSTMSDDSTLAAQADRN